MSSEVKVSGWKRGRRVAGASDRRRHHHHDRRHREDFAVEGVQDVSDDLSRAYARLRKKCKARRLVAAIRHCDARTINHLLAGTRSRVVCFFKKPGFDCVKICTISRNGAATVTSDICVRSLHHGYGYGGGVGFY